MGVVGKERKDAQEFLQRSSKMTRKELVELLESQYGEDDEVFVKYEDDQGEERVSGVSGIEDVTQTHIVKSRWEEQNDQGEWCEIPVKEAFQKGGCRNERIRYVGMKFQDITKKCIVVD